jgi:hypothetical protein
MAKYNTKRSRARTRGPIHTTDQPDSTTYEGAPAYSADDNSALYMLGVSNMVGEDTFYESATDRDARYRQLIHRVAVNDPEWLAGFLPWLRREGNLRSASLVGALEATAAMIETEMPGGRKLIDSVIMRADEPAEALAYWHSQHGLAIPMPVKRGVGDALIRLGGERNYIKYGTPDARIGWAEVLDLTHPGDREGSRQHQRGGWQADLFDYVLAHRRDPNAPIPDSLAMLQARAELLALPLDQRRAVLDNPDRLALAGFTWEQLAGWLQSPMDAAAWEAIIPSMGYMALLRNLRNFDEAHVSDEVALAVAGRLSDKEQVAKSRQFPYRFLSAHLAAPSLRWAWPLERALGYAVQNIPELPGRTLILVDTSASMDSDLSAKSKVTRVQVAGLFGAAMAIRNEGRVDLFAFADTNMKIPLPKGGAVLPTVEFISKNIGTVGHGTRIASAVRDTYSHHDRVVIFSDMQTFDYRSGSLAEFGGYRGGYLTGSDAAPLSQTVPGSVPMYAWDLAGYDRSPMPTGNNRHQVGGFTDAAFRIIQLLEAGRNADWPWKD